MLGSDLAGDVVLCLSNSTVYVEGLHGVLKKIVYLKNAHIWIFVCSYL